MFNKKFVVATIAATLTAFSVQADTGAKGSSSTTVRIQGFVPVLCRVNLSLDVGTVNDDGVAELGTAHEFCNAPRGYRVLVQHPDNLEGAAVIKDGERIPLSPGGETIISDVSHAAIRDVALAADLGADPQRFRSLSIRIEAKA